MFQLQCHISELKYEPAFCFLLQKITPHADPLLRPFLESISTCTEDITKAITTTIPEKEIQQAIVYAFNQYHEKLSHSIEKFFLKKGFIIEIYSLTVSLEENDFFVDMEFNIISSSIKMIAPLLSDKLLSRLFTIKPLTDAILVLVENAFHAYFNFAVFYDLNIIMK